MSKAFNLADLFEMVADAVPERAALVCGEDRASYHELEQRANQLAHYLASRGVAPGDHVGLYLYNCNEYLESMMACFKLRAVPINVNYRYVADELAYIFDNADLVACVHHREFAPLIAELPDTGVHTLVSVEDGSDTPTGDTPDYESALDGQPVERDFGDRKDDDLFLLYT
ncbi:MAG: AMP-binding protein, partial [Halieaceae bacterium]|nr:AMP-binding protein [Halieaceae bacterium]